MPDKILESVLTGQLDLELLLTWLRSENFEEDGEDCLLQRCTRNEFTAYFLSYLRAETESIVENDNGAKVVVCATPERSEGRVHRRTASDPTADTPPKPQHSPSREKKRSGRKVKTKLFLDDKSKEPVSPDDVKITAGVDRLALATSTPYKNESKYESACSSPRDTRSPISTGGETRGRPSRLDATLGDFLSVSTPVNQGRGKRKKRDSRNSDDLDVSADKSGESVSQSARKSTSLRSEKRRIKPTNIDLSKKSISLNNFGTEFQKVGALALENNEVFSAPPLLAGGSQSGSPGFAAERDILRRERHRLLEKFTSLSAATSPKCSTPLIKISQEESYVYPDASKVTSEDAIEVLVRVYQVLLDSNLILTYTNELCFLLALVRGKQRIESGPSPACLLRSVHNAAWFAARALRSQRGVLTALLDRPELRALAEARVIKTMAPDLAKSLLDVYGLRGETSAPDGPPAPAPAGHVVAWSCDTDGADNFPAAANFHSFKKQRDMFYDIARWYDETGGGLGGTGPSLRTRVRTLLATAAGAQSNYAHLGVLIVKHALANTAGGGQSQESRMSKLNRRLTRPAAHQTNALFPPEEEFYRELVSCTENEPFRAAVRDALATELMALDTATVHTGAALISLSRAAMTVSRLLGLLSALPHCPLHQPATSRLLRHLPYMLTLRGHEVPSLDVTSRVWSAVRSGRLCVTLPWTSAYLSTLASYDVVAPRLQPYVTLLRLLRNIYRHALPKCPPRTALYLRCTLSSLFAQQNIPQELLYDDETDENLDYTPTAIDAADVITETEMTSLLCARRELASLLAGGGSGARHVTPLRVGPEPHRARHTRELHIQKRLEEAVVRSSGGGARRVLELVCERVSTAALTNLTRALSVHRHKPTAPCDVTHIASQGVEIKAQIQAALNALLSERGCRGAECALAERAVRARLARHTRDTAELCESASNALRTLVGGSWGPATPTPTQATPTAEKGVDVATALIELKECVCLCLEQTPPPSPSLCGALALASRLGPNPTRGTKRTALQLSLDLCVAAACCESGTLTDAVLRSAERVWAACAPRTKEGGNTPPTDDTNNDKGLESEDDLSEMFSRLISPRVVRQVAYRTQKQWDALKRLVLFCTERGWLCPNKLTESCVALYSRDYSQDVVCGLGSWLRDVAGALGGAGGDAHSALFLGFLGEYCHDL